MKRLDEGLLPRLLQEGRDFVLYKHSPACGISSWTWEHMEALARARPDVEVYLVDVIGERPLSQEAASLLGVPHASPQVVVVEGGRAVWDASHMGVTADAVERALDATPPGGP